MNACRGAADYGRLSVFTATPAVTFPAAKHRRPLDCTLYWLVIKAYVHEQLAKIVLDSAGGECRPRDLLIGSTFLRGILVTGHNFTIHFICSG